MKRIGVFVADSGEMKFDFAGFQGDACFLEAQKLNELLAENGIEMEAISVTEKAEKEKVRDTNVIKH